MTIPNRFLAIASLMWIPLLFACQAHSPAASTQASPPTTTVVPPAKDEEKSAEDFFTKDERLHYNGYEIAKQTKSVREYGTKMDAAYLVVKKEQKMVASFVGPHHPIGNAVDFGLFPFLGKEKQLLVSITVPRGGRQWLAEVSPVYRVIFDTNKWGVGREGADLSFVDLNRDGVLEINAGDFWYFAFNEISMSETPVVTVIFRYDPNVKEYVPANHLFLAYSLGKVEERGRSLPTKEGYGYLGNRVDVLLTYLYAGKEKEGWEFFDRAYEAKDKAQVKTRIQSALKRSPVYQYVRAHNKN